MGKTKHANRLLSLLSGIICCFMAASAQQPEIAVASFTELDTDLTANLSGTMKKDQNGDICGLIKVVTTETGFSFDVGVLGVVATEQKTGEIWVYVPKGVRFITISHPQLGLLRRYPLPVQVQSARTYELRLVTGKVRTVIDNTPTEQYIVFHVTPPESIVEFDGQVLPLDEDGIGYVLKPLGSYDYRIECADYHTEVGRLSLTAAETLTQEISLRPKFGWIEVTSADGSADANAYVDGRQIGTLPIAPTRLSSGGHILKIIKPLYKIYQQDITVNDNDTTRITAQLEPDFRVFTVSSDPDADIYVNRELRGHGSWSGPLQSGTYIFEAKKTGHRPMSMSRTINADDLSATDIFVIPSPTPIFGSANITSSPIGADVEIDGKFAGKTPLFLSEVLIGERSIKWSKEGYRSETSLFFVDEGQTSEVSTVLSNEQTVRFSSNTSATIYVDGKMIGTTPCEAVLTCADHTIEARADMYKTLTKPYRINETTDHIYMPLEADFKDVTVTANRSVDIYLDGSRAASIYGAGSSATIPVRYGKHSISAGYYGTTKERDITVDKDFDEVVDFSFKENRIKERAFYISALYQTSGFPGWGAMLGWYISNFNTEMSVTVGEDESFISSTGYSYSPYEYIDYNNYRVNLKFGYGIRLGNHFRLTPQIGASGLIATCDYASDPDLDMPYAIAGVGSLQLSWVISSWLNVTVSPEYYFPISKSDGYKILQDASSTYKDAINGFDLQIGLGFIF